MYQGQNRAAASEEGSNCLNSTAPINASSADLVAEVEALGGRLSLVRERIGEIIFGQREVIEQALITLLCGGHALLIGVPGLAKTRLVETLGTILGLEDKRIQCTPDLMPADILGSEVLEESETGRRSFPLHSRPGLLPAADGGRNQPGEPAHAVGAPAGDAGGPRLDRRPIPSAAAPVSRAGNPEPARAGRHLSASRSAARPLPAADRCRLSRPRGRAADADRDDRHRRGSAATGDECRRADGGATRRTPHPGRRERRRGDPLAGALRAAGRRRRRRMSRASSRGDRGRAPVRP